MRWLPSLNVRSSRSSILRLPRVYKKDKIEIDPSCFNMHGAYSHPANSTVRKTVIVNKQLTVPCCTYMYFPLSVALCHPQNITCTVIILLNNYYLIRLNSIQVCCDPCFPIGCFPCSFLLQAQKAKIRPGQGNYYLL